MKQISFKHIHQPGHIVIENSLYKHIHYPEMLLMYDNNFIEFKKMPSIAEFKEAANYLRAFHLKNGQNHVKFKFPDNERLTKELTDFLDEECYAIGFNELYIIEPHQFTVVKDDPNIEIVPVTIENLEEFLELQYEFDLEFGTNFADQKRDIHRKKLADNHFLQILAYYKGKPAGSVDVIITNDTAEIDSFSVVESHQRKGIGSRIQSYIMNEFSDRTIILVADGEDTPRDMYKKQNYQCLGYKYEVQKVFGI